LVLGDGDLRGNFREWVWWVVSTGFAVISFSWVCSWWCFLNFALIHPPVGEDINSENMALIDDLIQQTPYPLLPQYLLAI
jgi:hypothetical protein